MEEKFYQIFKDEILIGRSKLENGDAPMGIAHGEFIPTDKFNQYRSQFEIIDSDYRRLEGLTLKTSKGIEVKCSMGKVIIEYGDIDKPFNLEFTALGIASPFYEKLFPHHVKVYREQFSN